MVNWLEFINEGNIEIDLEIINLIRQSAMNVSYMRLSYLFSCWDKNWDNFSILVSNKKIWMSLWKN